MLTVTIEERSGDKRLWVSRHRTNDRKEAIDKAIAKHFGSKAFFQRSNTNDPPYYRWYGQVFRSLGITEGATSQTGIVSIDTE